jgi:TP901 family phage tail tape measure protein
MAFNLVTQLQIQAPNNLGAVVSQIKGQLKNITANIDVRVNPSTSSALDNLTGLVKGLTLNLRELTVAGNSASASINSLAKGLGLSSNAASSNSASLAKAASSAKNYASSTQEAINATEEFGRAAGLAGRRFLGFSLVAGSVVGAIAAIKTGISEAVKFEREFIKLTQIGGATRAELSQLNNEITRLSTNLGVSSKELLETSVTLRQAGLTVKQVTQAMEVLAKTNLAPTFDSIKDTTEGAIAIMAQFNIETKDLEKALSSANAVAAAFAVESKDIIQAVQRAGGAFKSVGGDLNEFIALFTSVRQTTRESAEAIATGLRTVFTRLQRKDTVEALKDLGVNLRFTREEALALGNTDLESQFVGAYEGVRRLSEGLKNLRPTDARYAEVVEQLGGYRQISRVLPLIQQFAISQKALNVAQSGFASITTAADEAQGSFLVKLQKVKEEFLSLGRTIVSSNAFQGFLDTSVKLANWLVNIANALSPIIPLLTALTTFKLAGNITSFFSGVTQGFGGVSPRRLATGGVVPGSGNSDTVPAMLTPGEFVVKKSSARAIGYDKLAKMNSGGKVQKFADGGLVQGEDASFLVGNYSLNRKQLEFLYKVAGAPDKGQNLIDRNQGSLIKIFGKPNNETGQYRNANDLFNKLGFAINSKTQIVQSLVEFRKSIEESKTFNKDRNSAISSGKFVSNGTLILPFGGETIGFVTSGNAGGEAGKRGRDALNSGVRTENLSIENLGAKTNVIAKTLLEKAGVKNIRGGVNVRTLGVEPTSDFNVEVVDSVQESIQGVFNKKFGGARVAPLSSSQVNTISGYLFEKYVEGVSGRFTQGDTSDFEYVRSSPGSTLGRAFDKFVFPSPVNDTYLDLKNRFSLKNVSDVIKKYINVKSRDGGLAAALGLGLGAQQNAVTAATSPAKNKPAKREILKFATGGVVPGHGNGDTVPAMLTPGEFVVKKDSAKSIGYDRLSKLNSGGYVQKFAQGGRVLDINPPKGRVGLLYLDNPSLESGSSKGIIKYILDSRYAIDNRTKGGGGAFRVATGKSVDRKTVSDAVEILRGGLPKGKGNIGKQAIDTYIANTPEISALPKALKTSLRNHLLLGRGKSEDEGARFIKDYSEYKRGEFSPLNVFRKNADPRVNLTTGKENQSTKSDNFAVNIETRGVTKEGTQDFQAIFNEAIKDSVALVANRFAKNIPSIKFGKFSGSNVEDSLINNAITQQGKGRLFEGAIRLLGNAQDSKTSDDFDFAPISNKISTIFGGGLSGVFGDAKISNTSANVLSVARKALRTFGLSGNLTNFNDVTEGLGKLNRNKEGKFRFDSEGLPSFVTKFASGGAARGTDTVPAMLTPGEFVINKNAASRIGTSNLNRMNKTGRVGYYASGGPVVKNGDLSPSEVASSLNSGNVVSLNLNELSSFREEIKFTTDELRKGLRKALTSGNQEEINDLSAAYTRASKALTVLNQAVVETAKNAQKAGIDLGKVSSIDFAKENGNLVFKGASTLQGRDLEQEAKEREAVNRRIEAKKRFDNAPENPFQSLRTVASERVQGKGGLNDLFDAQIARDNAQRLNAAGVLSDASFKEKQDKAKEVKADALASIAKEEERIKSELINAEKKRISSLNIGISKQEISNIAQENVNKALLLGSRIITDTNGKAAGLALTMTSNAAALKLNQQQTEKLAAAQAKLAAQTQASAAAQSLESVSKLKSGSLLGASIGLSFLGSSITNTPEDIESAAKNDSSGALLKSGVSGALTFGATGAAIGSAIPVVGTAIGAVVGGLYGLVTSLNETEKEISKVKISQKLTELSTVLDRINKSPDGTLSVSQRDFVNKSLTEVDSSIVKNAREDATSSRLVSIFTGRFDLKKFNSTVDKERRETIGKELPGLFQILNNESAKLGENFAKTAGVLNSDQISNSLRELDGVFIETNRVILEKIAALKKVPVEEVAEDFKRARLEGFNRTRVADVAKTNRINITQELGVFNKLSEIVNKVSEDMAKLSSVSINLSDAFEGTISNVLVTNGSSKEFASSEFSSIANALQGSDSSRRLESFSSEFFKIKDILSSVLPDAISGPKDETADIGTTIRERIEKALGSGASSPISKAILGSIQSAANSEGLEGLKVSGRANINDLVEKLIVEASPVKALTDLRKGLDEAANKTVEGLIKYQSRIQRTGEQEDKVRQLQVAKLRAVSEAEANVTGARGTSLDSISLAQLQAPQKSRAERLTGLGALAESPEAIGNKLANLATEIEAATVAQQKAFETDKLGSDASLDAAKKLAELKRQSVDLQTALKDLTDASSRNAAVQEKLSRIQADRNSRLSFGEKFARAGFAERADINRGLVLSNAAVSRGNLDAFQPAQIREILDTLGSLGESKVNLGGKEIRASDAKEQLLRNSFGGVFDVKGKDKNEEKSLISELSSNFDKAIKANEILGKQMSENNDKFLLDLLKNQKEFLDRLGSEIRKEEVAKDRAKLADLTIERGSVKEDITKANSLRKALGSGINQKNIEFLSANASEIQSVFKSGNDIKKLNKLVGESGALAGGFKFKTFDEIQTNPYTGREVRRDKRVETSVFQEELFQFLQKNTGGLFTDEELRKSFEGKEGFNKRIFGAENPRSRTADAEGIQGKVQQGLIALFSDKLKNAGTNRENILKSLEGNLPKSVIEGLRNQSESTSFSEFSKLIDNFTKGKSIDTLESKFNDLSKAISDLEKSISSKYIPPAAGSVAPFATGGSVFKPRGTDTVPAMLTPGEFVVNAASAKKNRGLLEKINKGTSYLAAGGAVGASGDDKFNSFLNSLGEEDFNYIYGIGAQKVLAYYKQLQRGATGKTGGAVIDKISKLTSSGSPKDIDSKKAFLNNLPAEQKDLLMAYANKAQGDFTSLDAATPRQLYGIYSSNAYPLLVRKRAEANNKLIDYQEVLKNPKLTAELNDRYTKKISSIKEYINNNLSINSASGFEKPATPFEVSKMDLSKGKNQRDYVIDVIKKAYRASSSGFNFNEVIDKGLLNLNKDNKGVKDKILKAEIDDKKKVNAEALKEEKNKIAIEAASAKAALAFSDLTPVKKQFLDTKSIYDDKAKNMTFSSPEEAKKLKEDLDLKEKRYIASNKTYISLLTKATELSGAKYPDEGIKRAIENRAALISPKEALENVGKEVKASLDLPLLAGESLEDRARTIVMNKIQEERIKRNRETGGANESTFNERVSLNSEENILRVLRDVEKEGSGFISRNKIAGQPTNFFDESRINDRLKLLKNEKDIISKDLTPPKLSDAFATWKDNIKEVGTRLFNGAVTKGYDEAKNSERLYYNQLLQDIALNNKQVPPPQKFATGGVVGGLGKGDTVPAMLTPGEFVINAESAKRIGVANLHKMNAKSPVKFANGGQVRGSNSIAGNSGGLGISSDLSGVASRFESSANAMKLAMDTFASSANNLAQAMQKFPSSISGNFTHTVTMQIVGAEALAALSPEIEKMVVAKSKEVLSRYIRTNLPDAGQLE